MPSINESVGSGSQLAQVLASGVDWISGSQNVTFTTYVRSTIPTDGYVFWVNTGQSTTVKGSLHYSVDQQQDEDETNDVSRVIFTALSRVDIFNEVGLDVLFVGQWRMGESNGFQFAFSSRGDLYEEAKLFHYVGFKVPPAMASQLVDSEDDLPAGPIVSNSLPIWMALYGNATAYPPFGFAPVYPSYLVPGNSVPPYVTAHVESSQTEAMNLPKMHWPGDGTGDTSASPLHSLPVRQLVKDEVRLTFYGFTHQQAMQFYAALVDYSLNTEMFGFGNTPVIRDEKRVSNELNALAMKKTMDVSAWYYQRTADAVARRLIMEAAVTTQIPGS